MSVHDITYRRLVREILEEGEVRTDRTGTGTKAVFGTRMRFDLQKGFPLLTTKRIYWKGVVEELLWFLRGETNIASLQAAGVRIWDEWADENGDLGPVYGKQWRAWPTSERAWQPNGKGFNELKPVVIDQIDDVLTSLVENPDSRRHIVTAWNPVDVPQMKLPPCHCFFQFYVSSDNRLSCQLYQRSADVFLGVPFNIASYALLTIMMASLTGYEPGELIWVGGDTHIYLNHLDQVNEQLQREPYKSPEVRIKPGVRTIDTFVFDDFELVDYRSHPAIKAEVAV